MTQRFVEGVVCTQRGKGRDGRCGHVGGDGITSRLWVESGCWSVERYVTAELDPYSIWVPLDGAKIDG